MNNFILCRHLGNMLQFKLFPNYFEYFHMILPKIKYVPFSKNFVL